MGGGDAGAAFDDAPRGAVARPPEHAAEARATDTATRKTPPDTEEQGTTATDDGRRCRPPLSCSHSGMLPCLRGGFSCRLLASVRSERTIAWRVLRGRMTSST